MAGCATSQDRGVGITKQVPKFSDRDLADVPLDETGLIVGLIGKAAGGVQVDTCDHRQPFQDETMGQTTRPTKQIDTRNFIHINSPQWVATAE